jgi:hypothetical protein
MASPPQLGVAQYLAEMNELAGDLFRKLDLIHDQFVGLQFDDASIVSPATGLLGLSAELRDRLYRCHDMANMIRACVDGG